MHYSWRITTYSSKIKLRKIFTAILLMGQFSWDFMRSSLIKLNYKSFLSVYEWDTIICLFIEHNTKKSFFMFSFSEKPFTFWMCKKNWRRLFALHKKNLNTIIYTKKWYNLIYYLFGFDTIAMDSTIGNVRSKVLDIFQNGGLEGDTNIWDPFCKL